MTAHLDQLAALAASLPPGAVLAHVVTGPVKWGPGRFDYDVPLRPRAWAKIGDEPWRSVSSYSIEFTQEALTGQRLPWSEPDPEARWTDAAGHEHHNDLDRPVTWGWYHEPGYRDEDGEEYPGHTWAYCLTCGEEIDVPMINHPGEPWEHYIPGLKSGTLGIEWPRPDAPGPRHQPWTSQFHIVTVSVGWEQGYGLRGRHEVMGVVG